MAKHRTAAFVVAAIILLGGVALLTFPASQPSEPSAVEQSADAQAADKPPVRPTTDYGGMLLKMIVSVALVCLLAYAILRWGLNRLVGGNEAGEQMEILGRLAIAPNRAILVVRVGPRYLVVGSGETGISILTELSEEEAVGYFATQVAEE